MNDRQQTQPARRNSLTAGRLLEPTEIPMLSAEPQSKFGQNRDNSIAFVVTTAISSPPFMIFGSIG
jgi:hypothetical protein